MKKMNIPDIAKETLALRLQRFFCGTSEAQAGVSVKATEAGAAVALPVGDGARRYSRASGASARGLGRLHPQFRTKIWGQKHRGAQSGAQTDAHLPEFAKVRTVLASEANKPRRISLAA